MELYPKPCPPTPIPKAGGCPNAKPPNKEPTGGAGGGFGFISSSVKSFLSPTILSGADYTTVPCTPNPANTDTDGDTTGLENNSYYILFFEQKVFTC